MALSFLFLLLARPVPNFGKGNLINLQNRESSPLSGVAKFVVFYFSIPSLSGASIFFPTSLYYYAYLFPLT